MRSLFLFAMLATVVFSTPTFAKEHKPFVYKKTKQAELALQAYFPSDWQASDKRPAIVFFFGGGWNGGTVKQFEPQAKHLSERGMVAICANYRVKSRHGVSPNACVEDAKSAIRWVRQNAERLGIDPDRIVGAGGSAGGHLAACTGMCPGLDAPGEDLKVSSVPNVLVLYNPILSSKVDILKNLVGDDEDLLKALSPVDNLAKTSPPTLIFFGSKDRFLPSCQEFLERAKEVQHPTEFYLAENADHGFFNRPPWLEKTTQRMDEFLVSQGYLAEPEKTK